MSTEPTCPGLREMQLMELKMILEELSRSCASILSDPETPALMSEAVSNVFVTYVADAQRSLRCAAAVVGATNGLPLSPSRPSVQTQS